VKLILTVDHVSAVEGLSIAKAVAEHIDWVEVGSSMIKRFGVGYVSEMKEALPDKLLLAALKTIDDAEWEVDMACRAGADLMTVLGSATEMTAAAAVNTARRHDRRIVMDLVAVPNLQVIVRRMSLRGVSYFQFCPAPPKPGQGEGAFMEDIATITSTSELPLIVSADVSATVLERCKRFSPAAARTRKSILEAPDPVAAAQHLRAVVRRS